MTDYGHPLEFGVFVTPSSQDAGSVVALATLADRSGLDLVSFQDHPYQPRFLDTWTLLSFVAARTSRVRVARERPQPAASRSGDHRARSREPRHPERWAHGARARRRRVLGWDRGDGRTSADPGAARRRARGGDRGDPVALGRRTAGAGTLRRVLLPARRCGSRTRASARRTDLDRRVQAAHAEPGRPQGGRVAPEPVLPPGRRPGRGKRGDRRGRRRGRP